MNNPAPSVRVGVIGVGHGERVLVPAFRLNPRCDVVAIAARTQDRADESAHRLGLHWAFGDWRALVESPDVDVLAFAVPPNDQPPMVIAALETGKPVFCEKPLGGTMASVEEMAAAASASGLANIVDFMFPEIPTWQQAKQFLEQGDLGPLRHVDVHWSVETYANREKLDSWKTRSIDGGGALNNFSCHCFHYLEWFLGPLSKLSTTLIQAPGDTQSGETIVAMTMKFRAGISATVYLNTAAPLVHQHRLMFHGDDGTLVLENPTTNYGATDYASGFRLLHGTRKGGRLEQVPNPSATTPVDESDWDGRIVATSALIAKLLDWMETGSPETPAIPQGLRVQQLLDAARVSDKIGAWVDAPTGHHEGL